jgi:hypothetical protein
MTAGDAAAAIGFPVVAGTAAIRNGYAEINTSRDLLAEDITSGTRSAAQITSGIFATARLPVIAVDKGGTGATTAAAARSNLGIPDDVQTLIDDLAARVTALEG